MPVNDKLRKQIRTAVVKGIQRNADRVLSTSLSTKDCYVPVFKGFLRQSGYTDKTSNGAIVGFRSPYARVVEFGAPAKPFTGDQVVHIRPYTKTMKSGKKVKVKGHDKVYHNARLIQIWPKLGKFEYGEKKWVVMHQFPERKPQLFLSRALRKEIVYLKDDIAFYLKDIGKVT